MDSLCILRFMRSLSAHFIAVILVLFSVCLQAQIPTPYLPTNNIIQSNSSVLFGWNSVSNTITYELQYSTSSNFNSPTTIPGIVTDTVTINGLNTGSYYYWRVRSVTSSGPGSWSNAYQFGLFGPADFPNLIYWVKADEDVTTDALQRVTQWDDQSSSAAHASQADPAKFPTLVANGLNGKPVVRFDGSDALVGGDVLDLGNSNRTWFVLGKANATSSTYFSKARAAADVNRYGIIYNGGNLTVVYHDQTGKTFSIPRSPGNWEYLTMTTDRSTTLTHSIRINGIQNGTQALGIQPTAYNFNSTFRFILGAYNAGNNVDNTLELNGDIAEIFFFNTVLTDSSKQILEQYLTDKYAPPVNLGKDTTIAYGFCPITIEAPDGFSSYLWSTGSTGQSTTISEPGAYSVIVTDLFGRISTDTIVVSMPNPNFSGSADICLGDTVSWDTQLSSSLYTFNWSGPTTDSFLSISTPGIYSLTVTDTSGCSLAADPVTFTIDSFANKIDLVVGPDTSLCSGNQIGLSVGAALVDTYLWSTSATTPSVLVDTAGTYSVTVTNNNGCSATDSSPVILLGEGPIANFIADTACAGAPTNFTDASTLSLPNVVNQWVWHFGDGDSSTVQDPSHVYDSAGTYTVTLVSFSNTGCFSTPVSKQVLVLPSIEAFFFDSVACVNAATNLFDASIAPPGDSIVSWTWDFGNTTTSTQQNPIVTYSSPGGYNVELIAISRNSCMDTFSRTVTAGVSAPLPEPFNLLSPVPDDNISSNNVTFNWTTSDNASRYQIEVANTPSFISPVITQSVLQTMYTTAAIPFSTNPYYWRVAAYNVCGDVVFSETRSFYKIRPDALGVQSLFWVMADGAMITNANNRLSEWTDQSANAYNLAQPNNNNKPLKVDSIAQLNYKPVVRFNGAQFLNGGDVLDMRRKSRTMFIVGKSNAATASYLAKSQLSASPIRYAVFRNNGDLIYQYQQTSTNFNTLSTVAFGDYEMVGTETDRLTGNTKLFRNSTLLSLSAPVLSGSAIDMDTTFRFLVGAYNDATDLGQTFYLDGDIAEIIMFDTILTAQQYEAMERYIYNKYSGRLWLGNDIVIEYGFCDSVVLDASERYVSYQWNTGDTTQTLPVNVSGNYSVTVTDVFGQTQVDDINVTIPSVAVPSTNEICLGETVTWDAYLGPGYNYDWSTGNTDSAIVITDPGTYYVNITDTNTPPCVYNSDTFTLALDSFVITTTLGPDDTLCGGTALGLATNANRVQQYQWSTGELSPTIEVDTTGNYWVIATSLLGCVASDTISITISGELADVNFSVDSTGCLGDSTYYANLTTVSAGNNILSYQWSFGDTNTSSAESPAHLYDSAGVFTTTLTVETDSNCFNSATKNITIFNKPDAAFTYEIGCAGAPFIFRNQSSEVTNDPIDSYFWEFGDNSTSNQQNPTHQYNTAGVYEVSLTVTSQTGCSSTFTDTIEVYPELILDITADNLCFGQTVQFTDASPGASNVDWFWQFTSTDFATVENPTFTFNQPGAYAVTLTATNALGCEATVIDTVVITESPQAAFTAEDGCEGIPIIFYDQTNISGVDSIILWEWNFGDSSSTSRQQRPGHIYDTAGTYTVTLSVTSINGCTDQATQQVTISGPPKADFSFSPDFGASPLVVEFENNSLGATSYIWEFGDGDTSTQDEPIHTYLADGIYTINLNVFGLGGCEDDTFAILDVSPASLDLAVTELSIENIDGRIYMTALIANLGTRNVEAFDILVAIGNGSQIAERVDTFLPSGRVLWYRLSTSYLASDIEAESYLCLQTANPNNETDENLANDRRCQVLENNLKIVPPYPNPAAEIVFLDIISPRNENAAIYLVNAEGKRVMTLYDGPLQEGLNNFSLNVSMLPEGLYIIQVSFAGDYFTEKFVVDK